MSANQRLYNAARGGLAAAVEAALLDGGDVNWTNGREQGATPLYAAATNGHTATVGLLLDRGADIEAVTYYGNTPLHAAAASGRWTTAELLLDRGANMEAATMQGATPLHHAVYNCHTTTAGLLLDRGADMTVVDMGGSTILHVAAYNGHLATAWLLLDRGADIKAVDRGGWSPLHAAASKGHMDTARLLLDRGADVEAITNDGSTALMHTVKYAWHRLGMVDLLLSTGANVHAVNKNGQTALDIMVDNCEQLVSASVDRLLIAGSVSSASNMTLVKIIDQLPLLSNGPIKEMAYRRRRHFLLFLARCRLLPTSVVATSAFIEPAKLCRAERVLGIRDIQREIMKFI